MKTFAVFFAGRKTSNLLQKGGKLENSREKGEGGLFFRRI